MSWKWRSNWTFPQALQAAGVGGLLLATCAPGREVAKMDDLTRKVKAILKETLKDHELGLVDSTGVVRGIVPNHLDLDPWTTLCAIHRKLGFPDDTLELKEPSPGTFTFHVKQSVSLTPQDSSVIAGHGALILQLVEKSKDHDELPRADLLKTVPAANGTVH